MIPVMQQTTGTNWILRKRLYVCRRGLVAVLEEKTKDGSWQHMESVQIWYPWSAWLDRRARR